MPLSRTRPLRALSGEGDVYRENAVVCHARYTLTVTQIEVASESFSGTEWLEGQKEIRGYITVPRGGPDLNDGNTYCLHLQDGHEWNFFAKSGGPDSGVYLCVSAADGYK